MKTVLFVCSGNTCRSPMAEGLLRKIAEERGLGGEDGIMVMSAGLAAWEGDPASEHARTVAAEEGFDLGAHRARRLVPEMVREADLVLAMTERHKAAIVALVPEARDKVFTLKEFAQQGAEGGLDVGDPYGGSVEVYRRTMAEIKEALTRGFDRIVRHLGLGGNDGSGATG